MTGEPRGAGAGDEDGQLAALRWHWDLAYEINLIGGKWTARFLAGTDVLSAASADDLRLLIRADYQGRTASRAANQAGTPGGELGAGERALRRLRDEGVI